MTAKGSTASASMTSGGSAFSGAQGEILAEKLAEQNISAAHLAQAIRVPANRVSQILADKQAISADTALRLGRWFGTGPQLWLNRQKAYELDLATLESGPEIERIVPLCQPLPGRVPTRP